MTCKMEDRDSDEADQEPELEAVAEVDTETGVETVERTTVGVVRSMDPHDGSSDGGYCCCCGE